MKIIIRLVSGSIFLSICLFFGCCSKQQDLIAVRIFYLPKGTLVPAAIDSSQKMFNYSDILKDTIIKDKEFLKNYSKQVSKLILDRDSSCCIDMRIWCISKNKKEQKKELCLGEFFGTTYNGVKKEDNPELRKLIKDVIYNSNKN
jgi:hypothetical protein